jgi:hypothetical protein
VVAQGRKRADLAGTTFIFDESRYLLTSLDLPVTPRSLSVDIFPVHSSEQHASESPNSRASCMIGVVQTRS